MNPSSSAPKCCRMQAAASWIVWEFMNNRRDFENDSEFESPQSRGSNFPLFMKSLTLQVFFRSLVSVPYYILLRKKNQMQSSLCSSFFLVLKHRHEFYIRCISNRDSKIYVQRVWKCISLLRFCRNLQFARVYYVFASLQVFCQTVVEM